MKRIALLLILLPLGFCARGQETDSAQTIVGRYLKMMNYTSLPQDSMLVLETTITFHGSNDTFTMRRWFAPPTMMRVEVWQGKMQTDGFCTNGGSRHREYVRRTGWWRDMAHSDFHEKIAPYDFRGMLYDWQLHGIKLSYEGEVTTKGQTLQVVRARKQGAFTRFYFFEKNSGLLVLLQEKDEEPATDIASQALKDLHTKPVEYKVFHEYLPIGESLVPSQESFMRDGVLTIMNTTAHFEPRDNMIFNQD